jgi:molybdate transport system permease protein
MSVSCYDPRPMGDWLPAAKLSLSIALAATALVALLGVPLAFFLARRRFPGRSLLEALLLLPLVLPPTVVGYVLVLLIGRHGPVGRLVEAAGGSGLLFTPAAAVLAAAVVALPLLFLPAKGAFASVDPELYDLARLLGATPWQTFWHVSLPLARRSIGSGLLLAFARALGEFGATVMVLGDIESRRTLPISIYSEYVAGDMRPALPAVLVLTGFSLVVVTAYNRSLRRSD